MLQSLNKVAVALLLAASAVVVYVSIDRVIEARREEKRNETTQTMLKLIDKGIDTWAPRKQ